VQVCRVRPWYLLGRSCLGSQHKDSQKREKHG
jgi:hypothetical protein